MTHVPSGTEDEAEEDASDRLDEDKNSLIDEINFEKIKPQAYSVGSRIINFLLNKTKKKPSRSS